VRLRTS